MVIRMRHTRAHTKNRRSHHALKAPTLSTCGNCGEHHRPHHMCLNCGYYKGRQVIDLEAEKTKREARIKAKRERILGEQREELPATDEPQEVTEQDETKTPDTKKELKAKAKESDEIKEEKAEHSQK